MTQVTTAHPVTVTCPECGADTVTYRDVAGQTRLVAHGTQPWIDDYVYEWLLCPRSRNLTAPDAPRESVRHAGAESLDEVAAAGYITDEWKRWQQGGCETYAVALLHVHPHLRMGTLRDDRNADGHFFAHDDTWAYDSAGRHRLPYHGIHGDAVECLLDQEPEDHGLAFEGDAEDAAAEAHIRRHRIGFPA